MLAILLTAIITFILSIGVAAAMVDEAIKPLQRQINQLKRENISLKRGKY